MSLKQVIVMRTDLQMRKGKMIAQGAHASMMFLLQGQELRAYRKTVDGPATGYVLEAELSAAEGEWALSNFTKVCVRVDSEEGLFRVYEAAKRADLRAHMVQDSGRTEFGGVPTFTCCAIGPDTADRIDPITGGLTLL